MARFQQPAPDTEAEYEAFYREELAWALAERTEGITLLQECLDLNAEPLRLRAAIIALCTPELQISGLADFLRTLLHHANPTLIATAIRGLSMIAINEDWDAIKFLLDHSDQFVRGHVLGYVARSDEPDAPAYLLRGLNDPDQIVRQWAIDGLDELGVVDAVPTLFPLLGDPHPHPRQAAETAIENLYWSERGTGEDIVALRSSSSPEVRASVLRYLSDRKVNGARTWLLEALADPHPIVRANAIDELVDRYDRDALPQISALVSDPDDLVQSTVARAMESLCVRTEDQ